MQPHRVTYFIITTIVALFLFPCSIASRQFVLVIDAGHGGKDPGAIGTYSKEKNINLNVAMKVGELIQKNCPDVRLVFTRRSDIFVDLDERANIANRAKANLFISIHTNALENGKTTAGSETYSLGMARAKENLDVAKRENSVILYEQNYQERYAGFNPNSSESYIIFDFMQDQQMKQSAELAQEIQKAYSNAGRPNMGVHQAGFLVLRKTSMPSVLTELGFITTPQEEAYLNSAKGTNELAQSIYEGFLNYRKKLQRSQSVILSGADQAAREMEKQDSDDTPHRRAIPQDGSNTKVEAPDLQPNTEERPASTANRQAEQRRPEREQRDTQKAEESPKKHSEQAEAPTSGTPIFKVQIYTSNRRLRPDAPQFKQLSPVSFFQEKNVYKYTYGSSTSYKEIAALRKTILEKFPDCFIVAFRDDKKIPLQDAIRKKQ